MTTRTETQVGIVGAGPAGLVLSHLLDAAGIESIVLEDRSREYVEHRVRAGVLEQGTVDLLCDHGLGDRLRREGLVHHGIELRFDRRRHHIPLTELANGRSITIYGQQEIVKDLIAARLAKGRPIEFEVEDVSLEDLDTYRPSIRYRQDGADHEIVCDFVAGCDGFHGVSREAIPAGVLTEYDHEYPFAWLGVLATVAPSVDVVTYASHERGFALHSLRSPSISRLYLEVDPSEDAAAWPDGRIWKELSLRLATDDGWSLREGPIVEKQIAPMRSFVVEPMQYGRLFLAGDAAHIVPATGAKGLNLAVADVRLLARAIAEWYATGSKERLEAYSSECLRRVWRAEDFSWFMSTMLHRGGRDGFSYRLQLARLRYVTSSEAAARSLAENYVGLPFD
jgi:p-hydroxybenzoate 3-monooxygenase